MNNKSRPNLLEELSKTNEDVESAKLQKRKYHFKQKNDYEEEDDLADFKKEKICLGGLIDKKLYQEEEIKKWVEARKKRFPSRFNKHSQDTIKESEQSLLEKKLRTKLLILQEESPYERSERRRNLYFLKKTVTVQKKMRTNQDNQNYYRRDQHNPAANKNEKKEISNTNNNQNSEIKDKNDPTLEADKTQTQTENKDNQPKENNDEQDEAPIEEEIVKDQQNHTEVSSNKPPTPNKNTHQYQQSNNFEREKKSHSFVDMKEHLKMRRNQDREKITFFNEKNISNHKYQYIQNTLDVDLILDDILEERKTILGMIDYFVKNDFLKTKTDN
jgi:hypothetical protein